jgi:hypothetical protein
MHGRRNRDPSRLDAIRAAWRSVVARGWLHHKETNMLKLAKSLVAVGVVVAALLLVPGESALARNRIDLLTAHLDGRQEISPTGVPGAGDPDGRGFAIVVGLKHAPTTLCYLLAVRDIAPAVAAHIHQAPAGTNGGIVVNLTPPTNGLSADCVTEGETLPSGAPAFPTAVTAQQILDNPAGFYVNVHNAEFPAGAIRGQLRGF